MRFNPKSAASCGAMCYPHSRTTHRRHTFGHYYRFQWMFIKCLRRQHKVWISLVRLGSSIVRDCFCRMHDYYIRWRTHTHTSTPTQLAKDKKINERVLCAAANTISYLMSFSLSLILFTHTPFHRLLLHFRVLRLVYLSIRTTRVYNYWRYSPSSSIFISIVKALYVLVDARTRRHSTGKNWESERMHKCVSAPWLMAGWWFLRSGTCILHVM